MSSMFDGTKIKEVVASSASSMSPTMMWIIAILVLCVIGVGLYLYFKPKAKDALVMGPIVLHGAGNASGPETIQTVFNQSQVNNSLGNNFTLSAFVYMDDVNRERIPLAGPEGDFRFKPFLYILGVGDILLDPIHQVARVRIKPLMNGAVITPGEVQSIDVEQFMIARWNQLTVTLEGRSVDVYLNGALVASRLLENLPTLYPQGVLVETSPDFSGQAGLFQAWPSRLSESQVMAHYKRNVDTRGKPLIPERYDLVFSNLKDMFCKIGFCASSYDTKEPLDYVEYQFA